MKINFKHPSSFNIRLWFKKNLPLFFYLAFLVLLVYINSFENSFISDDIPTIAKNKDISKFSHVFQNQTTSFVPLLHFISFKIGGLNPFFFRIFNILFHIANSWLVFILLSTFTPKPLPFFAASIFAVHPVLTEAVTWISGGPYVTSAFFLLIALATYIISHQKKNFFYVSLISFVFSFSVSEKSLSFTIIPFLYEFCFGNLKKNWKKIVAFFIIGGIFLIYHFTLLEPRITSLEKEYYVEKGFDNPLIKTPTVITTYFKLLLWPQHLTFYHSTLYFNYFDLLIFALFSGLTIYSLFRKRFIFFWISLFLVSLSPSLLPIRIAWAVAERYVYFGSIGIITLVAFFLYKLALSPKLKTIAYLLLFLIIILLSAKTITRNIDWKNEENFWIATAKASPEYYGSHNNLADIYAKRGDLESAAKEFQTAINLYPKYADAYHNLALVYRKQGKMEEAIEIYKKAIAINPNLWESYQNLGALYFDQNNLAAAKELMQKALTLNPKSPDLLSNLGIIYSKTGEKDKAKEFFQKALEIDPEHQKAKEWLLNLENK